MLVPSYDMTRDGKDDADFLRNFYIGASTRVFLTGLRLRIAITQVYDARVVPSFCNSTK